MCFFGLQNLVDGYVVGNYVSEKALGGVNIITPLFQFCNGDCYFTRSGIHRYRDAHFAYFLGERGIWLTLVLSEVLTLAVSILLARRSVVFNE